MQKKLIALAVAGVASTAAFAQSNVTISGQVKAGYERYSVSNGTGSASGLAQGHQNMISDETSQIVLKGTESLGNGLSAIFQIDSRFTPDTGNSTTPAVGQTGSLGSGNTFVGLASSALGEFKLGRHDLHYNEIERIENGSKSLSQQAMAGRGILNQVNGVFIAGGGTGATGNTRTNNVAMWDSPNWGGVTARLAYSTNPVASEGTTAGASGTAASDQGGAWNGVVRYEAGPIKTGYSYYQQQVEGGTTLATTTYGNQKSNRVWGAYTIAGVSLGLAWDKSYVWGGNAAGDVARSAWAIPVSYNMGNHGFYATYAKANNASGGFMTGGSVLASNTGNDSRAEQIMLGYDYTLSKRTSVGMNYTKLENKDNGAYNFANNKGTAIGSTTAGSDAKQWYIGMRHAY